jgi:membrane protein
MLIWIYYAAQIVLFGAAFTQVYAQERGPQRSPPKYAVRVKRREIELPFPFSLNRHLVVP